MAHAAHMNDLNMSALHYIYEQQQLRDGTKQAQIEQGRLWEQQRVELFRPLWDVMQQVEKLPAGNANSDMTLRDHASLWGPKGVLISRDNGAGKDDFFLYVPSQWAPELRFRRGSDSGKDTVPITPEEAMRTLLDYLVEMLKPIPNPNA